MPFLYPKFNSYPIVWCTVSQSHGFGESFKTASRLMIMADPKAFCFCSVTTKGLPKFQRVSRQMIVCLFCQTIRVNATLSLPIIAFSYWVSSFLSSIKLHNCAERSYAPFWKCTLQWIAMLYWSCRCSCVCVFVVHASFSLDPSETIWASLTRQFEQSRKHNTLAIYGYPGTHLPP